MLTKRMKRMITLVLGVSTGAFVIGLSHRISHASDSQEHPGTDVREYYPLALGNMWVYQIKQYRADGQVFYRLRTQVAADEVKIGDRVTARRIADDRGQYSLISVDASRFRVYVENDGQGEVKFNPPMTYLDVNYTPGKSYTQAHIIGVDEAISSEASYWGLESVTTPAGSFRDCLKVRFQSTKPSGATTTVTRYLAKGVGVVREIREIFSPAAQQSLRYETDLLHGTIGGKKIGGEADQTVKIAEYFPFHQGDSWTYDWTYRMANGQSRTTERKRWFEGTKFTNSGAAFRLVQNTGEDDYQYYTLDKGGLRITESGEKGMRAQGVKFVYEPGLLIGRNDMVLGRTYRWSQAPSDGGGLMQFSTVLEGFENVETPMGRYENCLRARVEWDTSSSRVRNIYYYARGVGLVAYDYEVVSKKDNVVQIALNARLKDSTINANHLTTAEEGKTLWDKMAAELVAAEDNPTARKLFREASLNRYVWDADLGFRGFTADLVMRVNGGAPIPIKVKCSPALDIEIDAPDAASKAIAHEEISQFVTHREPRKPFDNWYGPDKAKFKLGKVTPEGQEIFVEGDSMGSSYVINNKQVRLLSRNIGRMDFTIFNNEHLAVEDGRYIATDYGVSYYTVGTKEEVGKDRFVDKYVKQGAYWVPKSRVHTSTLKRKPERVEIEVTRLEYLK
jgi:uncharacterized protein DUF3386